MVAARAEYRVKSRHGASIDQCVEDAKSTVRWLRRNKATLGIDPDRIAASGGSAGGHLAAADYTTKDADAANEDLTVSSKPNLLVLFNPVLGLDDFVRKDVSEATFPADLRRFSPNQSLDATTPPAIVFFGTEDPFIETAEPYLAQAAKMGREAHLYLAGGKGHGFFNSEPWLSVTLRLADEFLARHGYLQGPPTRPAPQGANMTEIGPDELKVQCAKWFK
jgi:acetyl esterase/lipase